MFQFTSLLPGLGECERLDEAAGHPATGGPRRLGSTGMERRPCAPTGRQGVARIPTALPTVLARFETPERCQMASGLNPTRPRCQTWGDLSTRPGSGLRGCRPPCPRGGLCAAAPAAVLHVPAHGASVWMLDPWLRQCRIKIISFPLNFAPSSAPHAWGPGVSDPGLGRGGWPGARRPGERAPCWPLPEQHQRLRTAGWEKGVFTPTPGLQTVPAA